MKLGVFAVLFGGKSLDDALDYICDSGLEAVELGCASLRAGSYDRGSASPPMTSTSSSSARWVRSRR